MNTGFTVCLYAVTAVLLAVSSVKDRVKTRLALLKAWKIFVSVLPQFLAILLLAGLLLAVTPPETIQTVIGRDSGFVGWVVCALLGSVAVVPVLVAFPLAAQLLQNGAGLTQIAVFISALTTVGIVTLPMEIRYLGRKVAIVRNLLALLCSFAVALAVGVVLG